MQRRNDIDWLRIFATYVLFVFHVGKVFDSEPFYQIKNGVLSEKLAYFTGHIHLWHMPLFFILAGWSVYSSLQKRGGRGFLGERFKRIFIPFFVGCIVICPPLQYVYARTAMGFDGSFWDFLPQFFTTLKYFSWSHLWFLAYLFTFTLLYLRFFIWISRRDVEAKNVHPVFVYLPIAVLVLIQVTLRPIWPGFQNLFDDWANFSYYSVFFIMGFLFARYPAYEKAMHGQWKISGAIGLAGSIGLMVVFLTTGYSRLTLAIFAVPSYCIVIFILGLGKILLSSYKKRLPWFRESAYPTYILHQSSIVLPGYFIVRLEMPIAAKYFMLLAIAVSTTILTYRFIVKPFGPVRFFFGMRPMRSK